MPKMPYKVISANILIFVDKGRCMCYVLDWTEDRLKTIHKFRTSEHNLEGERVVRKQKRTE